MRYTLPVFSLLLIMAMSPPTQAADIDAGEKKFRQLCSTCHGPAGAGDGPASAALNPKPRNLSDAAWQESVDDEHLRAVITRGGTAVGLSPMMTPFGGMLKDDELQNVIAFIRSLAKE